MLQHPTHPPAHIIQPQPSAQATYSQESSTAAASSSTPTSPRDGAESPTVPTTAASTVTSKPTRGRKRKPTPAQDADLSAQGLTQPISQPPPPQPQQQPTPPPQTSLPHPHPHPHLHPPQFAFATGPDGSVQPYPLHPMQVPVGAMLVSGPPPQAPPPQSQHQDDQYSSGGSPGGTQPATHNGRVLSATKRAEQNRKAQRAFRERRDAHVKALESRSQLLDAALASVEEANRRWEEARQMVESLRLENSQLRAALGAFQQAAQQVQAQARSTQPQPHESASVPTNVEQDSGNNAMETSEDHNQDNGQQREENTQA